MTEVDSDEFDADRDRLPSITPEEWAEIKRMTRQESIRPSNIEGESSVLRFSNSISEVKLKSSKLPKGFSLISSYFLSSNCLHFDLNFLRLIECF